MGAVIHEIKVDDAGNRHGTDGRITTTLLGTEGRMFKRRAVKNVGTENATEECWLVAELKGVRVYQKGTSIIVTDQDLYP